MACKLNIKADNGKDSLLFRDIMATVANPSEAVDVYFFTKTDEFKRLYGDYASEDYSGPALDSNAEPRFSTFTDEAYIYDVDYADIEINKKAEVYKHLLTAIPEVQNIIDQRVDYISDLKGKKRKNLQNLKDIQDVLSKGPINESIPKFLNMANAHVFFLRKQAETSLKNPDADIRELASLHKISQSYSVIEELRMELLGDKEMQEIFDEKVFPISATLDDVRAIRSMYIEKSKDFLVHEFSKRDKTWKRAEIRRALEHAPRDLRFHERLLEYIGDSPDEVLSMVGRIMMEAEHKIRRSAIDFNKRLQEKLQALEDKGLNSQEIFDKIIIEKHEGELHVVDLDAIDTRGAFPFRDADYRKLQDIKMDKEAMDFLVFFTQEYRQLQAMLPASAPVMGTRIPTVLKSQFERVQGKNLKERYEVATDGVKKKIQRSNLDMERGAILDATGKPIRRIPTFYTQKYDSIDYDKLYDQYYVENLEKGMEDSAAITDASERAEVDAVKKTGQFISHDLAHSLQVFHAMALNYSAKNELLEIFESAEAVVSSEFRKYTVVDSGGRIIQSRFNKTKEQTRPGMESVAHQVLNRFLDMQLYGQKELDLGFTNIMGAKVDNNSVLRQLNRATGLVQLGGNVLAGIANIGNGEYNNVMESMGGEYYKVRDYSKASGFYKKNLGGILKDIGARTPNNIVNLLSEHYNILQSFNQEIKTTERTKFKRMFNLSALFFINNAGEHMMQVRAGLAILESTKAFNKDGVELGSLLDQHSSVKGKLNVPQDIYVKDKDGSFVKFDENQQNRISDRIGAVLRKLHGNYSQQTANMMKQDARLALVIKYRDWAYEGFIRRWGKKQNYRMLEQDVEGFYRTGGRVIWQLAQDLRKMKFDLMKENWQNLTPHEKANVRRFVIEGAMITAMFTAGALLSQAGKLMDEEYGSDSYEDNLVLGSYRLLTYETNRLYTEIFAYINPIEAVRLARTPMASTSIIENTLNLLWQAGFAPGEEYETGWRKGKNKTLVKMGRLIPLYKQIETMNPDGIQERARFYN